MFKQDEAACLLAERFNIIGWIYKQEPIMFNRLANRLAALPIWTRPLICLLFTAAVHLTLWMLR